MTVLVPDEPVEGISVGLWTGSESAIANWHRIRYERARLLRKLDRRAESKSELPDHTQTPRKRREASDEDSGWRVGTWEVGSRFGDRSRVFAGVYRRKPTAQLRVLTPLAVTALEEVWHWISLVKSGHVNWPRDAQTMDSVWPAGGLPIFADNARVERARRSAGTERFCDLPDAHPEGISSHNVGSQLMLVRNSVFPKSDSSIL